MIERLADAIAYAEGFFVDGSRPQRNHNPGDLTLDLTGKGVGFDGPFVQYANDVDGWQALYKQVEMMLDGTSGIYDSGMSILEMAAHYTATESEAWAANVASRLGVSVNTRLSELSPVSTVGVGLVLLAGLLFWFLRR